jgi:flavin reductase (DIM6/NTAB) family NADH-FMN oxidoreductase RutF
MFATGVTVVATVVRDGFHATTANSFTSLSLDPRLVLICLDTASRTLSAILEATVFSVSVLSECQEDMSRHFADRERPSGWEAFSGTRISLDGHGCPRLDESLASFACRVHAVHEGGDHVIVVGEVVRMTVRSGAAPLVFHDGGYRTLFGARDYVGEWAS